MKFINKFKNKITNNTFFQKQFGFEQDIDIASDNEVLYRKNTVIKNIIFLSNMFYTIVFALVSLSVTISGDVQSSNWSNWLLTILFFPITFIVNQTLKKMIKRGPNDNMSQVIAMYFACFYMFLSAIIVYIKLKYGSIDFLKEVGYILIYYSIAVCSFYQDKKLLKNIYLWLFIIVTILHFIVTYDIFIKAQSYDSALTFLNWFIKSDELKDIIVRTIIILLYMLVVYIYVSMAAYMQEERKKELIKRREIEDDYTNVVTKIFEVTLSQNDFTDNDKKNIEITSIMSKKLASLLSLNTKKCDEIYNYSLIHINNNINLLEENNKNKTDEERFESLREKTELGSKIIERIQLSRKCEDIVRAALEGSDTDEFIASKREIQNNIESQIILICELYVTMRSIKSYKRAYNNQKSIQFMEQQLKIYFDSLVFERFMRFQSDFEKIYDEE